MLLEASLGAKVWRISEEVLQGTSKRVVGRDNTHENRARKACMEGTYEVPMILSPQGHSRENKCPLSGLTGG